jgi:hypothetical protein
VQFVPEPISVERSGPKLERMTLPEVNGGGYRDQPSYRPMGLHESQLNNLSASFKPAAVSKNFPKIVVKTEADQNNSIHNNSINNLSINNNSLNSINSISSSIGNNNPKLYQTNEAHQQNLQAVLKN